MIDTAEPADVVRSFCATWRTGDVASLVSFFSADATYRNMPDAAVFAGHGPIGAAIEGFFRITPRIDFTVTHLAAIGEVVLVERVDRCGHGELLADLPVAGVFRVRGDKIVEWRDYYDKAELGRLLTQTGAMVVPA